MDALFDGLYTVTFPDFRGFTADSSIPIIVSQEVSSFLICGPFARTLELPRVT